MADINVPNYVHYSRLKTINLDEAASLLAHFELRDQNVTDVDEYNELFIEEKRLANKVLYDANMCKASKKLSFYINRAGSNLSDTDKARLA